jgi:orotidine-5'-phosphate decarboxylase
VLAVLAHEQHPIADLGRYVSVSARERRGSVNDHGRLLPSVRSGKTRRTTRERSRSQTMATRIPADFAGKCGALARDGAYLVTVSSATYISVREHRQQRELRASCEVLLSNNGMAAEQNYLSTKRIPPRERLMFALDVPSTIEARRLVEELGESVVFYKLGLELFMAGGYFELLDWLRARGKQAFVDLKFFDVPQTVASAVLQLRGRGASFVTIHGNDAILAAAVDVRRREFAKDEPLKILAVTVLTSLDRRDMDALGFKTDIPELVLSRAARALQIGCDGVISSGLEARRLREEHGTGFVVVVPGIRPVENVDDQKRTVDVEAAFLNGADYIVVGRPIKNAPDKSNAAEAIQARIATLFSESS